MNINTLIQQSYQTLMTYMDDMQVILLHPNSVYRTVVIAKLVNDPAITTFYYAMGPDDIDIQSFINGITHDVALQHPTFGRHLNALPNNIYEDFHNNLPLILETFARDLSEMSSDRFVLILDEFDRSDIADDVQRFIERLALILPENCRLIINSRTLPRISWVSLITQNKAVILKDDERIIEDFYGITNDDEGYLEVYALGPGFVLLNNSYIDAWEGHLPRLLFFFALDRPVITRSDICSSFWPELNADQAVNVFHVTKRRLHKALDLDVLSHVDGYYGINPELRIYYDVLEFAEALIKGRDETVDFDERVSAWERAINLYRGPFLQGHNDQWILERRADFRIGYIEALRFMADVWKQRDYPEQALVLLHKALAEDLFIDDLNQEVMRLYAQLGRRNEAAAHYQKVQQALAQNKQAPSEALQALYEEVLA